MSQDKRDKNNADRAKSSAQADDLSPSSANKPSKTPASDTSTAGSSAADKAASKPAGAQPGQPGQGAGSGDERASSNAGKESASSPGGAKADPKPAQSGGGSNKATGGEPKDAAGSNKSGPAGVDRASADKTQSATGASQPADRSNAAASGDAGKNAGGASGKTPDKTGAAASAASSASGKSGPAGSRPASGKPSTSGASTTPRSSASNTSGSAGQTNQTSASGAGRASKRPSDAGRPGGPATGGPKKNGSNSGGRGRPIGLIVAVVALIVAVLAAAVTGYLWYRGQQRVADLDSRINTVEKSLQSNVQKVVMPKLSDMRDRMDTFSERTDQLSQKLDQRQQQIAQLQQTIQHVQHQNKQLSDQLGGNHERFVEQRIALLLEAANQRLQVERDPKGAARALALADQAIQKSGDPALHPVRAKIADERAALKALPDPDIEGMSLKLSNVIARIPKLALKSNVPSSYRPDSASGGANPSGKEDGNAADQGSDALEFAGVKLAQKWHQFVNSVGGALSRMVTIRRANGTENAPALMAPDQSYFLVQNLQLQLRSARLALLGGNAQAYHDALAEARDWVQKYFDTSDSAVSAVLDDLSQLSHVKLDWQAPDLSASLNTLHRIMNQNGGNDASAAAASPDAQSNSSAGEGSGSSNDGAPDSGGDSAGGDSSGADNADSAGGS